MAIRIERREGILPDRSVWQVLDPDRDAVLRAVYDMWGVPKSDKFAGPTCVSIERRDFSNLKSTLYWVCEKTDGVRYMLACLKFRDLDLVVIVNRNHEVFLLGIELPTPAFLGTVFDGEIAIHRATGRAHYLVFDAMAVAGTRVAAWTFGHRMSAVLDLLGSAAQPEANVVRVQAKKFFPLAGMQEFSEFREVAREHFDDDGVVFTPDEMPVETFRHRKMFKWKEKHTVDFEVGENLEIRVYDTAARRPKKVGILRTDVTDRGEKIAVGDVVECVIRGAKWHPLMVRTDKKHSNDVETFRRTLGNVKENIAFDEFLFKD
jgi:hypothetical protein